MGDIGGFGAKSAGKSANKQGKSKAKAIQAWGQPSSYTNWIAGAMPQLLKLQEPGRMQAADAAAYGATQQTQALDADASRRGLAGSGYHLGGRQAIQGQRQALNNDALIRMYQQAGQQASGEAGNTIRAVMSGIGGVPFQGVPSTGAAAADTASMMLALRLMGGA